MHEGWLGQHGELMAKEKSFYSTRELAEMAAERGRPVTQEYVRRLCKAGKIAAHQPGRDWIIPASEAKRWLETWLQG
jgi:excisionase family DNA binding protein